MIYDWRYITEDRRRSARSACPGPRIPTYECDFDYGAAGTGKLPTTTKPSSRMPCPARCGPVEASLKAWPSLLLSYSLCRNSKLHLIRYRMQTLSYRSTRSHWRSCLPSLSMKLPLMCAPARLDKKITSPPMSSGVPIRPIGYAFVI